MYNSKDIYIDGIISDTSTYGIIWKALYQGKNCALKIVILDTGIHKRKDKNYYNNNKRLNKSTAVKYFTGGTIPFEHKRYKNMKTLKYNKFLNEVDKFQILSNLNLSPQIYSSGIIKNYDIHYGYILMEKADCTLKDIIHKRDIKNYEFKIINENINKLHSLRYIHGDFKPSNIGVYLNTNQEIYKCQLLDCAKVKHYQNINNKKFNYYVFKEWKRYYHHVDKNIKSILHI